MKQIIKTQGEFRIEFFADDSGLRQGEHKQYVVKSGRLNCTCEFKDDVLISPISYYNYKGEVIFEMKPTTKSRIDFNDLTERSKKIAEKIKTGEMFF